MNGIVRQSCSRKKLSHSFQTLSHPKPFTSHKWKHTPQNKRRLDKALRVLDLITPKPSTVTSTRQTHLRLVQNMLPTDDFAATNANFGITDVFDEMLESYSRKSVVDASVLSHAVSSCGSMRTLPGGIQYHCSAIRTGFVENVYGGSSLISLYGKCAELENAYRMFEEMPVRNVVSWTAIIAAFAREWQVDVCLDLGLCPVKIFTGHGRIWTRVQDPMCPVKVSLDTSRSLFHQMRNSTWRPNEFTFTSLLSACTGTGALGHGRSAHCQTIQMGFDSYIHIANALVSMYCKCGAVEDALYIFEKIDGKDIVSWNSMIVGYAQHGLALQAIDLYEEMKKQSIEPDAITFLGVLSSCRHAGLVKEGWFYFNSMVELGVQLDLDHYSCVVDLLGRAGLLDEAKDFIEKMPIYPNAVIWGSLLSSSRLHGSVWIGIRAAENRLLLEPSCSATLVQLANLYASVGYWDRAAGVWKLMKDRGLKTKPGYSWVEIKDSVCQFRAEDRSNPRMAEIVFVLDILVDHMKTLGYEAEMHEEVDNALFSIG